MKILFVLILTFNSFLIFSQKQYRLSGGEQESYIVKKSVPIIKEMYSKIDIDVEFEYSSFERSLVYANSGKYDGELVRFGNIAELYPDLRKVPEPVFNLSQVVFSLKKYENIKELEDLRPYRISYIRGAKFIENILKGYKSFATDSTEKAFRLLFIGRVDFVFISKDSGLEYLNKAGIDIYYFSDTISSVDLFHYVHKKNESLIPDLEKALLDIKSQTSKENNTGR